MKIQLIGEVPDRGPDQSQEFYIVEVDGTRYVQECWATSNASGEEWENLDGSRLESGNPFSDDPVPESDELDEQRDVYWTAYNAAFGRFGGPAIIEQAKAAAERAVAHYVAAAETKEG